MISHDVMIPMILSVPKDVMIPMILSVPIVLQYRTMILYPSNHQSAKL